MHCSGILLFSARALASLTIPTFIHLSLEMFSFQLRSRVQKELSSLLFKMLAPFVLADLYHLTLAVGMAIKNRRHDSFHIRATVRGSQSKWS